MFGIFGMLKLKFKKKEVSYIIESRLRFLKNNYLFEGDPNTTAKSLVDLSFTLHSHYFNDSSSLPIAASCLVFYIEPSEDIDFITPYISAASTILSVIEQNELKLNFNENDDLLIRQATNILARKVEDLDKVMGEAGLI